MRFWSQLKQFKSRNGEKEGWGRRWHVNCNLPSDVSIVSQAKEGEKIYAENDVLFVARLAPPHTLTPPQQCQ